MTKHWQAILTGWTDADNGIKNPVYHVTDGQRIIAEFLDEDTARLMAAGPTLAAALQDLVTCVSTARHLQPTSALYSCLERARATLNQANIGLDRAQQSTTTAR